MREKLHAQLPFVLPTIDHPHAHELERIGERLTSLHDAAELVHADLVRGSANPTTGRRGMSAEQVLRALILKQMNDFSYEELGFHLADSRTYRSFCCLGWGEAAPSAKTLQRNIKRVRPETLEAINRAIVRGAAVEVDDGSQVRIDCTVVETNIHAPTDSALLSDCVRVLVRLLRRACVMDPEIRFADHTTRAKRRAWRIQNIARKGPRRKPYEDLLKVTRKTVRFAPS